MSTINRFFGNQGVQPLATFNPISFSDLSRVPAHLRQKEDAVSALALENTVLASNVLNQDNELTRKFLDPIEQQSEELISSLAKNGYTPEKERELKEILQKRKITQRDILNPLEQKKKSIAAQIAEIDKFYKDDTDTQFADFAKSQLLKSVKPSELNQDGQLTNTGVNSPFYSKKLTTEDRNNILFKIGNQLKADGFEIDTNDPQRIQNFILKFQKRGQSGVTANRIKTAIEAAIGPEVMNSLKYEGLVFGIGSNAQINDQLRKSYSNYLKSEVENITSEKADEIDSLVNSITDSELPSIYARLQKERMLRGAAGSLANKKSTITNTFRNDEVFLATFKNNLKKQDIPEGSFWPTVPGSRQDTLIMSPLAAFSNKGDKSFREKAIEIVGNSSDFIKSVDVADAESRRIAMQRWEKAVSSTAKQLENPVESKQVNQIIDSSTQLKNNLENSKKNYLERGFSEKEANKKAYRDVINDYNNTYKNLGQTYSLAKAIPNERSEEIKDQYINKLQDYKIVNPKTGPTTFDQFIDNNDLDIDEFYESLKVKNTRNVVGHGNMIEATYRGDDGKDHSVFIQSPIQLNISSDKSIKVDQGIAQGLSQIDLGEKIIQGGNKVREVAIPNYKTGRIEIYVTPVTQGTSINLEAYVGQDISNISNIAKYDFERILKAEDKTAKNFWENVTIKQGGKKNF